MSTFGGSMSYDLRFHASRVGRLVSDVERFKLASDSMQSTSSKTAEDRHKAKDSFNDYQKDTRGRVTQLASYAFLLAGSSFTATVTVFSSRPRSELKPALVQFLHSGWCSLFLSMAAFFSLVAVMVIRDYFVAEAVWRPKIAGKKPLVDDVWFRRLWACFEVSLVILFILGSATLGYGLYNIMEAARALVA
ncbi:hypothetical protein [Piscinibacter sp. HJYY11]|uniref:hypothetical protein n=1 Tax=Piscinibacter sp. HJYY11 TaxID=2801333 RepID=UPI00191EF8D7|nr:hypothetical protein [Piscinibacter sp. HJYY11]MBL0729665.1 hypothetical protein [Piscinibacter sp. HJYY11]